MLEGTGIMAIGCKDIEQAKILITELWNDDVDYNSQEHGDFDVLLSKIKQEEAYKCPVCKMHWIDDRYCNDCERKAPGKGKKVFTIYFD